MSANTLIPIESRRAALEAPGPSAAPQVPLTFADVERLAMVIVESGLFGMKTPQQALALMMLCQAEGIHPMEAVRRYDIINGRPAMKAATMQAEFQRRGGEIEFRERSDAACEAHFQAGRSAVTVRWDMDRAKRAGLLGKAGPWQQYPAAMLHARCVSEGVRAVMPGVVAGIYTLEEVQDMEPIGLESAPAPSPRAEAAPAMPASPGAKSGPPAAAPLSREVLAALEEFEAVAKNAGLATRLPDGRISRRMCRQAAQETIGEGAGGLDWESTSPWIRAKAILVARLEAQSAAESAAAPEEEDPFAEETAAVNA